MSLGSREKAARDAVLTSESWLEALEHSQRTTHSCVGFLELGFMAKEAGDLGHGALKITPVLCVLCGWTMRELISRNRPARCSYLFIVHSLKVYAETIFLVS